MLRSDRSIVFALGGAVTNASYGFDYDELWLLDAVNRIVTEAAHLALEITAALASIRIPRA